MSSVYTHTHVHCGYQKDFEGHGADSACRCAPAGESVLPVFNWFPELTRWRPSAHPRLPEVVGDTLNLELSFRGATEETRGTASVDFRLS